MQALLISSDSVIERSSEVTWEFSTTAVHKEKKATIAGLKLDSPSDKSSGCVRRPVSSL